MIPLALLSALILNVFGNWAHTTSEQVRLDALALSLCHSRRLFILENFEKINGPIKALQNAMDAAAYRCVLAPPQIKPAVCRQSQLLLKQLSEKGKSFENMQEIKRRMYPSEERSLKSRLAQNNQLTSTEGNLQTSSLITSFQDGFSRETTKLFRKGWEALLSVKWPQTLVRDETFERLHSYHAGFQPRRALTGVNSSNRTRWYGLTLHMNNVQKSGQAATQSGCRVLANPDYRVQRKPA